MNFRNCEDCNMCCKLPSKPNIKKDYEWCSNCDIGVGCKIYDKRPKKCKDFYCLWKIGTFPRNLKPNKVGFFGTMDNELSKISQDLEGYADIKAHSDAKYNAAIDQLTEAAEEWNQAVRGYKAQ